MKISVAMATFNGAHYIEEQLRSIVNQSILPDEIIISDDGSTDSTVEIAKRFLCDSGIYFEIHKNDGQKGFSSNFGNALMRTRGDIVFLSDQDDYWAKDKIEILLACVSEDMFLLMSDMSVVDGNMQLLYSSIIDYCKLSSENYTYGCSMAVSRNLLNLALPIPSDLVQHDVWLSLIAYRLGVKHIIHKSLLRYRRHGKNVTTKLSYKSESVVNSFKLFRNFRSSMLRYHDILSIAHNRISGYLRNNKSDDSVNRSANDELLRDIRISFTRTSGTTLSRIIGFKRVYRSYRDLNISFFHFIKDTISLNRIIQSEW